MATIYMVEHVFSDALLESDWNDWYNNNIRVLLGVPGFHTAQRFRTDDLTGARYMAMYDVESAAVFDSAAYRNAGGGGTASERFRSAYREWVRNLFDSPLPAPAIGGGESLQVRDGAALSAAELPQGVLYLTTVGLHITTPARALLVTPARASLDASWRVYRPLADQSHAPAV